MPDNVIEVDFGSRRPPRQEGDIAEDALRVARDAIKEGEWYEGQWLLERRRSRAIARTLRSERQRSFSFSDEQVLEALRCAEGGEHVSAGAVAAVLLGHEPTHSARVRTGRVLSRLAKGGRVIQERAADDPWHRIPCRWAAYDA